ncbi:MAG: SgcJ/EcaC family oxidoreductase [Rhodopirellula sp.]|nr:SgcJ/EcaC family oxidoreductase [Rhodopirellula sp.]
MRTQLLIVMLAALSVGFGWNLVLSQPVAQSQEVTKVKNIGDSPDAGSLEASAPMFEKAFNAGDSKAVAALFTADAEVVDEDGNVVQGRANIEARFAGLFKQFPQARNVVELTSLRQLSTDVAVEEGFSTTTLSPDDEGSRAPYSIVHLKRDGKWLMARVRDFPEEAVPNAHDQLRPLEWLVGHWVDESQEGRVETTCRWSEDGNYLLQDYVVKPRRGNVMTGTQRIGWDPLRRTIRSWAFDHSGAFTEANWTPVAGAWVLKVNGVTPDGQSVSVTRFVTPITEDSFQIDSTNLLFGNEVMPDSSVRVVKRPPAPTK